MASRRRFPSRPPRREPGDTALSYSSAENLALACRCCQLLSSLVWFRWCVGSRQSAHSTLLPQPPALRLDEMAGEAIDSATRRLAGTHGIHTMTPIPTRCSGSGNRAQDTTPPDSRKGGRQRGQRTGMASSVLRLPMACPPTMQEDGDMPSSPICQAAMDTL